MALARTGRLRTEGLPTALAVVALWVPLFVVGTVLHESLHAVAVIVLGSHPVLVLRPWPLALFPLTITGIHVQPVPALDPVRQFLDNLLGPGFAAIPFAAAALAIRGTVLRYALVANALGLAFFALIEGADVVLDGRLDLGVLTAPEFNYGVPLAIAVLTAAVASRSAST